MSTILHTCLGTKGYTLLKTELTIEEQQLIKTELNVKPHIHGFNNSIQQSFPVYRESINKIYVPHYYGISKFGIPLTYKICQGQDINLTFNGTLRDYQSPVVDKFIKYVNQTIVSAGLLELPCAWGKTSASLYILSQLKKKTLVIVHKEFLMNQWIERIHQFLPDARIGKIQGPIVDIENKEIVLCMIQSLVSKEYNPSLFSSFGFTIIDEVHHISSQTFSNSLFKVITKYMLGLSATMERKDGTTKIFKMFLGEVVHQVDIKNEHEVEVRSIVYKTNDEEFNDTILDYKGNPQISSMISKLCQYNYRTEFILKVLNDFIKVEGVDNNVIEAFKHKMDYENPNCQLCNKNNNYLIKNICCGEIKYCLPCVDKLVEASKNNLKEGTKVKRPKCVNCKKVLKYTQNYIENPHVKPKEILQTIILSHNLNVLEYMYTKIVCKNLASVGYYVGGMKECDLKQTETKQIILASYAMASEGLDIPSLNAEFLITPKTDIIQTVGRILRSKHSITKPVIYDFVDNHGVFQRQWLKRKSFYKKQNYKIIKINSGCYTPDYTKWNLELPSKYLENVNTKTDELSDDDDNLENISNLLKGNCLISLKPST
jgi:superfamily II DNA or RNA helicase